jgi:hypothetical protein
MVAIGDKTRRKVHSVATTDALGKTNFQSASAFTTFPAGNIVFDPLETLAKTGDFQFTAPYSRFYKIRCSYLVENPFHSTLSDSPSSSLAYGAGVCTYLITEINMNKNGTWIIAPAADGGIYSQGSLTGGFSVKFRASPINAVKFRFEGTPQEQAATAEFVTFLECGDTLSFRARTLHNGFVTPVIYGLKGKGSPIVSTMSFTSGSYQQNASFTAYQLQGIDNNSPSTQYGIENVYNSNFAEFGITFDGSGYIEIIELDRD